MKNPYYKEPADVLFNAAAVAIDAYMFANSDKATISKAALAALPEVQAIAAAGYDLTTEGVQSDLLDRVAALVP